MLSMLKDMTKPPGQKLNEVLQMLSSSENGLLCNGPKDKEEYSHVSCLDFHNYHAVSRIKFDCEL